MEMACWFGWFAFKDEKCNDYNLSSDIASFSIWHIFLLIMKHCAYVIYVILQFSTIPQQSVSVIRSNLTCLIGYTQLKGLIFASNVERLKLN